MASTVRELPEATVIPAQTRGGTTHNKASFIVGLLCRQTHNNAAFRTGNGLMPGRSVHEWRAGDLASAGLLELLRMRLARLKAESESGAIVMGMF